MIFIVVLLAGLVVATLIVNIRKGARQRRTWDSSGGDATPAWMLDGTDLGSAPHTHSSHGHAGHAHAHDHDHDHGHCHDHGHDHGSSGGSDRGGCDAGGCAPNSA